MLGKNEKGGDIPRHKMLDTMKKCINICSKVRPLTEELKTGPGGGER